MAKQLLFYDTAVPLTEQRHGKWSVEVGTDYGFSRNVNSVPIMSAEFARAAAEYPIVFAGVDETVSPAVILGMRGNENLFLTDKSAWQAKYIPAFVRRYPFVFSSSEDGKLFTLCIDETFAGVNQEGRGERLFDDDGKPTQYVQNVLAFLQGYQTEYQRTQNFSQKIRGLGLLEPMQAQVTLGTGQIFSLTGFSAVNREKLKNLPADKIAELLKADELELIFLHLNSLQNFQEFNVRLSASSSQESAKTREEEETAEA